MSGELTKRLEINLKEALQEKSILFDTCVITKISKKKALMDELFNFLSDIKCKAGISDEIYVEFLRGHDGIGAYKEAKAILESLFTNTKSRLSGKSVPNFVGKIILTDLINRKYGLGGKASYVDLTLSVYLQRWPGKLFLATFNQGDFSNKIFDTVSVIPLNISNRNELLSIIVANKDSYNIEKDKINKEIKA